MEFPSKLNNQIQVNNNVLCVVPIMANSITLNGLLLLIILS